MAERETLEIDALFVGAGPASLAGACHLARLLKQHNAAAARKVELSIAVLEKGAEVGAHALSGAVVDPRPLRALFRGRLSMADVPTYGEVPGEAVYVLTRRSAFRIPAPPPMRFEVGPFCPIDDTYLHGERQTGLPGWVCPTCRAWWDRRSTRRAG